MGAPKSYRTVPVGDLTGGINDTAAETALRAGQGLRVENWDLDKGGLSSARGSIKFNNQIAPRSSVRCRPDPALTPLYFKAHYSVPLRGYCWAAYNQDYDIGGDFAYEGSFDLGTETFHNRRGHSFQFDVTFRLPEETRLYAAETRGANAPAVGSESAGFNPPHGFDEALDDCTIILQKGGDQTTPMSWALGLVNIGNGTGLASAPATRASNYALVFMWLDAPQFGESSPTVMRYTLTTATDPSTGAYSTQAYRAVLIHKYVEPGRTYTASVQLGLDTGSCGSTGVNTAWNHDGYFKVYVGDGPETITSYTFADSSGGGTPTNMEVVRGPTDSLSYLTKYGVRFSGRDRFFFGLGMRSFPWMAPGFIPYGSDCTSIEYGGFQMLDRSAALVDTLYGGGVHTLTVAHVSGDAYVKFNHQYASSGNTNGGISPYAIGGPGGYSAWTGLHYNTTGLKGYRLIATNDFTAGAMKGGVLTMDTYSEGGGEFRMSITNGATPANFTTWAASHMLIQCFRWNQRPIDLAEVRIWSTPRNYEDGNAAIKARRRWDIGRGIDISDRTNYDIETLRAYWPLDDAEGATLAEKVVGGIRSAFMAPGGLGTTTGGTRGARMLAMSGEGEAPCIDFSGNPVVLRALKDMLSSTSQGFAIELSCVFPQAYYAIQDNTITLPDRDTTGATVSGSRPLFVPEILSWDAKDPGNTGQASTPKPILTLTHRGAIASTNGVPFKFPCGFSVEVAHRGDNENVDPIVPQDLQPFYVDGGGANHNRYSYNADWVGKNVTIQIGVQATGTADQYDVYVAMSPKDAFLPASGDPGDAEFCYWTAGGGSYSSGNYFTAAHLTIKRKDIERSVITLGRWNCGSLGYSELQPCMLVDEVRVYATSAPGSLPTANGGILTSRNGKLEGLGAMPSRELTVDDILRHVTPTGTSIDVTDSSATVSPHGNARFFTGEARSSIDCIKETYLYVPGESQRVLTAGTLSFEAQRFYRIASVASDGSSLTLAQPFPGATRSNAYGASMRLIAYTAFGDDIRDKPLSLGVGSAYVPGVTTVSDVILSDDFWENAAPIATNWKLRVYSPFGRTALSGVLPQWVRGLVGPRRNPIRGIYAHQDKVYAAVRGALFEADDRWRTDGPSATLTASLAFRSKVIDPGIAVPLARDRVEFLQPFTYSTSSDSTATYFDSWVKLDSIHEYQTLLWVGDVATDPSAYAGSTGHKVHAILRTNRGRPELVFGSTAFYTGTTKPEKGLFIATGATPIPAGEWTHIRFAVPTRTTSARVLMKPQLKVNGRKVTVTVNATDNGAAITGSYDWITYSTLVSPSTGKTMLGVAHDAYRVPTTGNAFIGGSVGVNVQPQYLWGLLHALDGQLTGCAVTQAAAWSGSSSGTDMPDFDPFAIDYSTATATFFNVLTSPEGVAHKLFDSAQSQYGTIYSHPFVSVWHEMGSVDIPTAFAEHGNDLVITSGAKPARVNSTYAGFCGMPAPTTEPSFSIERFPMWKPNVRSTSAESASNDPVAGALDDSDKPVNHYDNHGLNYWRQTDTGTGDAEMVLSKTTYGRMFAFKAYVKPRKVEGRIVLYAARNNVNSGEVFVEIRDGKLAVGFFDIYLKKEVWVETSKQVLTPGYWHYIYVRKKFPQQEAYDGNWVNSYYAHSQARRGTFSAVPADTLAEFVTIADGGGHNGRVVDTPNLAAGFGTYAANGITKLDYIKLTAAELTAGAVTVNGVGGYTLTDEFQPVNDSLVVRRFGTALTDYTDNTKMDPLLAKVGQTVLFTITAGTQFAAGDVVTGASGGVATVLWAHTKGAVTATVQNVCLYFTSGTSFTGNCTGGGVTTSTAAAPGNVRDCISMVWDDKVLTQGGATGWVTRLFAGGIFGGAAGGVVNYSLSANSAVPFHPGMVGMYWMWGSLGSVPVALRGKLYRVTSVSEDGKQLLTVIAGTNSTDSFAGIANSEGGVFMGIGLKKSDSYDSAKSPEQAAVDIRAFGHSDSASESSGISPFDGEWACPGWTTVEPTTTTHGPENYQPFETGTNYGRAATNDAIEVGTDFFKYPIFALGAPERLRFDSWAASPQAGTWFCPPDVQTYAGAPATVASSQPNFNSTANGPVVTRSTSNTVCSTNAPDARVLATQTAGAFTGTRYIRYCFYDKNQDALSNPSPALPVSVDSEDTLNTTSQSRYTIGSLGVPRRTGNYETWVFMGLAGGTEDDLFRVAQVPAGTSEVAVSLPEVAIESLLPMEIANGEPPRCNLVASDGTRMYYGALETDKTAGLYSVVGNPASIDFTATGASAFFASGGEGDEITCLHQLDQQILIAKRRMMGTLTVDGTNPADIKIISRSIGCVAPQSVRGRDNRVYFLGERGLGVVSRYGNTNLGIPVYISSNVQELYQTNADRSYDNMVVGALNEKRGQYIHTYRPLGETRPTKRVVAMFKNTEGGADGNPLLVFNADSHAYVLSDVLALSALGTVPGAAGQPLLVGGTDDGFMVWMDRADTQYHLMGETAGVWLTNPTTATSTTSTNYVQINALAISDTDLEGARGILMRFLDGSGTERSVRLLGSSGKFLIFDEVAGSAPAASGTLTFGAQTHYYETGWMAFGDAQQLKNVTYMDIVAKKVSTGLLRVDFYRTGIGDANDDTVVIDSHDQDMSAARRQVSPRGLDGRWLKVVVRSVPLTTKAAVSISDLIFRLFDIDQD